MVLFTVAASVFTAVTVSLVFVVVLDVFEGDEVALVDISSCCVLVLVVVLGLPEFLEVVVLMVISLLHCASVEEDFLNCMFSHHGFVVVEVVV